MKNFAFIKGIIFSGGPSTVTKKNFTSIPKSILLKKIPILGICYGLQLIAKLHGGRIKSSKKRREFGRALIFKKNYSLLTKGFFSGKKDKYVWMSHEDAVVKLPNNFKVIAYTKNSKLTIIENSRKKYTESSFTQKLHIRIMEKKYLKFFIFNL